MAPSPPFAATVEETTNDKTQFQKKKKAIKNTSAFIKQARFTRDKSDESPATAMSDESSSW